MPFMNLEITYSLFSGYPCVIPLPISQICNICLFSSQQKTLFRHNYYSPLDCVVHYILPIGYELTLRFAEMAGKILLCIGHM